MCDQDLDSTCEDNSKTEFIIQNIMWTTYVAEGKAELGDSQNYGKKPVHQLNKFINQYALDVN